jgi:hypothetical protein
MFEASELTKPEETIGRDYYRELPYKYPDRVTQTEFMNP